MILLTNNEKSFGAVLMSPDGDIFGEMCSKLNPVMHILLTSLMTTAPLDPLNAQHSPGCTLGWKNHYS